MPSVRRGGLAFDDAPMAGRDGPAIEDGLSA